MQKILSIVIPCYNKFNFTKSCLKDLSYLPNDHEIIIVDNASTDETRAQLEHSSEITYLRNETNEGFAKASNRGYGASLATNVLFLNNDTKVRDNLTSWTQSLIDQCSTFIVGPTMGQLDKNLNFIKEENAKLTGNSYMSGWCLASSKEIFNKLIIKNDLGPFSTEFFCYFEDTDLSFRARKQNIPMNVVSIPIVHFGKKTSSQLNTAALYTSARKIFVKKWAGNV